MAAKKKIKIIAAAVIIAVILFLVWVILLPIIKRGSYEFVYLHDKDFNDLKFNILYCTEHDNDSLLSKIPDINESNLSDLSLYSIDNVNRHRTIEPENIEIITDDDSKLILITYCSMEAKKNPIHYIKEISPNNVCAIEKEKAGILYCTDHEILKKYSDEYARLFSFQIRGGRDGSFMVTPVSENGDFYYFCASNFINESTPCVNPWINFDYDTYYSFVPYE